MHNSDLHPWLKSKGYLHLTPQLDILGRKNELTSKVTNPDFVAKYAFFPLIHSSIKERKFKKGPDRKARGHSFRDGNEVKRTAKSRPLHYATHMDSLIFGFYAHILLKEYENKMLDNFEVSKAVLAYRQIRLENMLSNKSTIHFAREVFEEIQKRATPQCTVLKYDIKSFFNRMDHKILLKAWADLLGVNRLPEDHYNVFKACTRFSYVLRDDFRTSKYPGSGKKSGFDEKRLAEIRNEHGINCFFESVKEFRNAIKAGKIKIHRFPFRHETERFPVGIPQGLPISAVLANLYLLKFDQAIVSELVVGKKCYYRRYSDDIVIICESAQATDIDSFITSKILESRVEMSLEKKEEFVFKEYTFSSNNTRLCSFKVENGIEKVRRPLTYLGFEFFGYKTLVKSTNLAKFYRRMISNIKKKSKRAIASNLKNPTLSPALYYNQLRKLYTLQNLSAIQLRKNLKTISSDGKGGYTLKTKPITRKFSSNYLKYIGRVNEIIGGKLIKRQLRNHKRILKHSIKKHFRKYDS